MRAVHGKRDGKANRPFCSRVMKERRVVMKERAIPGPCNWCPRGPRIQYYSMGLAIWTDCIPKRDIYTYIQTYNFDTVLHDYMPRAKALGNYFSYKFKILNNKEKPPATGKLNQWWKQRQLSTCMIIELHFTDKEKKDTNKKIKKISIEIKKM